MTFCAVEKVQLNGWRYSINIFSAFYENLEVQFHSFIQISTFISCYDRYAITVLCHMLVYLLAWLFFDAHRAEEANTILNAEDGNIFRVDYFKGIGAILIALGIRIN